MKKFLKILILIIIITALYNRFKLLPEGVSEEWSVHNVPSNSISFISDETYVDNNGDRYVSQDIFDEVISMINNAEEYILIDMFLFNDFQGKSKETTRSLSADITEAILQKDESVDITVITDPINNIYGGLESDNLSRLEDAGVNVVISDLTKLRDSNIIYSSIWRPILRFLPLNFIKLPNPFDSNGDSVGANSYLTLLNMKANHRKLIVSDEGEKMITLVTSANPHDGSSAHGNVALRIEDKVWRDVIDSEIAIGDFSNDPVEDYVKDINDEGGELMVQLITESKIRGSVLESIKKSKSGDAIYLSMFYLSDKKIVRELIRSHKKGVNIRVVLDPNKDAFGREKNGIPNRVVANDLVDAGIDLRWCDTHGEQCHGKMMLVKNRTEATLILGSANYTRRNLKDFNLETNVIVSGSRNLPVLRDADEYFNRLWNNEVDKIYTTDFETYEDRSFIKKIMYNIMEITGLSSF